MIPKCQNLNIEIAFLQWWIYLARGSKGQFFFGTLINIFTNIEGQVPNLIFSLTYKLLNLKKSTLQIIFFIVYN